MPKRKTTYIFIKEAIEKYGDLYDYSLVEYINSSTDVKIICRIHGIFEQTPNDHLSGCRCPFCYGTPKKTNEQIIKDFLKIHTKYDYSLVNYMGAHINVTIICPIHGPFEQTPHDHLKKQGCPKCAGKSRTLLELKELLNNIHNNKYNYKLVIKTNTKLKCEIICPIHSVFEQDLNHHLTGQGCPKCNESKGEKEIRSILETNNIKYKTQKTFNDCKYVQLLKFDFYLPEKNICIEFDGQQHYEPNKFFGGEKEFIKRQIKDKIKNEYCQNNNIHLIRIKYNENVNEKLSQLFF